MNQIKIVKYNYNKSDTNCFEVRDSNGQPCWIKFEQMGKPHAQANCEEFMDIPIEEGY